jgi:pimeloyl-ACP methyl ester carboxylesterase
MNQAGYATLAIDELGVGESSHPPSALVTQNSDALALHEVIAAARSNALGERFAKIVVVGHSFGSLTSVLDAASYHDVDGVILSGFSTSLGPLAFAGILTLARPALFDPVTAPQVPPGDLGYLSVPGARAKYFYNPSDADPNVVAADEAGRSPVTAGVGATVPEYLLATSGVEVPVLIADGQDDAAFCEQGGGGSLVNCSDPTALKSSETPYFSPAAELQTFVLPGAGHDVDLSLNAAQWFAAALGWSQRWFPTST